MKNTMLQTTILRTLARLDLGLRESTLMAEVEIAMDRPTLTTDDFTDAMIWLEDRDLVANTKDLMDNRVWSITQTGRDALKGM